MVKGNPPFQGLRFGGVGDLELRPLGEGCTLGFNMPGRWPSGKTWQKLQRLELTHSAFQRVQVLEGRGIWRRYATLVVRRRHHGLKPVARNLSSLTRGGRFGHRRGFHA